MITIEEPPAAVACASCQRPIAWLYAFRTGRTFSVVVDETDRTVFRLHACRELQDQHTWRTLLRGDPPNDEYREAKNKIAMRSEQ